MGPFRKFVAVGGVFMLLMVLTCAAVCAAPQPPCHKHHQTVKACDADVLLDDASASPLLEAGELVFIPAGFSRAWLVGRTRVPAHAPPIPPSFSVLRI